MKVLICSALSHGHMNMSLRLSEELLQRGHDVAVICNETFEPIVRSYNLQPLLFVEDPELPCFKYLHLRHLGKSYQKPKSLRIEDEAKVLKDVIIYQQMLDGDYARLIREYEPDVILQDHVLPCPAVIKSGIPWVRLMSCNPLYLDVDALPAATCATRNDATSMQMQVERAKRDQLLEPINEMINRWLTKNDLPTIDFYSHFYSPDLNFYLYPKELDYFSAQTPLPGKTRP
jgi:UDP:flavonoid glycosyltransferase YjiC (YdhE family)